VGLRHPVSLLHDTYEDMSRKIISRKLHQKCPPKNVSNRIVGITCEVVMGQGKGYHVKSPGKGYHDVAINNVRIISTK